MTAAGYPELFLHTNGSPLAIPLTDLTAQVQQSLFDDCGVLVPIIRHGNDERLAPGTAELWLDEEPLGIVAVGELALDVLTVLRRHGADLVTPQLVVHYLRKLGSTLPVLVAAVQERITVETLRGELQDRLRKGGTIRDLPGILEELLARDLGSAARVEAP